MCTLFCCFCRSDFFYFFVEYNATPPPLSSCSALSFNVHQTQILKKLNHPNIVRTLYMRDGWPFTYIVFEYITGKDLLHIVDRDGRLPEPQARMYFSQLVSAVDYAHSLGIAHRDIKVLLPPIASSPFFHPSQLQPENILVDKFTSRLVLIDFGLSSFMQPGTTFQDYCGSPR